MAFEALVGRFQDLAFAVALAYLGDREAARDAAQEAFIEAHGSLSRLRIPRAFPTWLKRIVRKRCDRQTRAWAPTLIPLTAAPMLSAPPVRDAQPSGPSALAVALATIPLGQRLVLTMFHVAGTSLADIASTLGIPLSAVKKRLHDGRQRLKEDLRMIATDPCPLPSASQDFTATVQFFLAIRAGDLPAVSAALDRQPNLIDAVEQWDSDQALRRVLPFASGQTPLLRAVQGGDRRLVELLLARGADPTGTCGCANAETALHQAALAGDADFTRLLLMHGAPHSAAAFRAMTPLHVAAMRGHLEVAQLLLGAGAQRDARDGTGRTPLEWAQAKGHGPLLAVLGDGLAPATSTPTPPAAAVPPRRRDLEDPLSVSVPVGDQVVGRRLDALGEVIDQGPDLDGARALLSAAEQLPRRQERALWETGIKAIDLFAPLERGGRISFTGGFGCGRFVVLAELIHRMVASQGRVVWVGWESRSFDLDEIVGELREFALHPYVTLVWHRQQDPARHARLAGRTAMTIAEHYRREGREVLLIAEGPSARRQELQEIAGVAGIEGAGAITALMLEPPEPAAPPARLPRDRDGRISLDRALAVRGLYPAINPCWSRSRLEAAGDRRLLTEARRLLAEDAACAAGRSVQAVSTATRLTRAQRLRAYLVQAFHGTDFFVGAPGVSAPRDRACEVLAMIMRGACDDYTWERLAWCAAEPHPPSPPPVNGAALV
jgi:F-type H+-transporting ATPase subunit beta